MDEFRWILLALGLLLIVGIWWWGSRRSTQAPGNAALRESSVVVFKEPEFAPESPAFVPEPRERSAPGFEPVSIDPAEFDRIPMVHDPIMVDIEPAEYRDRSPRFEAETPPPPVLEPALGPEAALPAYAPTGESEREPSFEAEPAAPPRAAAEPVAARAAPVAAPTGVSGNPTEQTGSFASAAPSAPNTAEKQKIISVRVCATGTTRWQGNSLLAAFELNGLAYGRYQVFHRRHVDGRSLFCVASMTEPGVFDVAKMQNQEFRGVTLFAVLPGPLEPMLTVDELLLAARDLAVALSGAVQDVKGAAMTAQRASALRDEVARFQASLAVG